MKFSVLSAMAALVLVAGCTTPISETEFTAPITVAPGEVASWTLGGVTARVPADMVVSDGADQVPPPSELVWFGDGPGDKKEQVAVLLRDAIVEAVEDEFIGSTPVDIEARVILFHAMTPKARASSLQLGVHTVRFSIEVRDSATGELLASDPEIRADLVAFSGVQAVEADESGESQKVRITRRIVEAVSDWLESGGAAS